MDDSVDTDREPYDSHPTQADDDRNRSADDRDRTAEDRDRISDAHDEAADTRDERASARDDRSEARDEAASKFDSGSASDRAGARRDRRGAASDRGHAADDREAASTDRALSSRERQASSFDELTGAYGRQAGMVELARERARARRMRKPLVLAFVDVDGLKTTNDTAGHGAGDALLRRVVDTMRARLRPYDLIIRYGGDEFLCALFDFSLDEVAERFTVVNADLEAHPRASVTAGFAELAEHDTLDDLISRADAALRTQRPPRQAHPHNAH